MKFALISDLHMDDSKLKIDSLNISPDVDLIIIAGDLHPSASVCLEFLNDLEKKFKCEVMFVPGNHDYWGKTPATIPMVQTTVKGIKVAGATLWSKLNPQEWVTYMLGMNDYRFILNWEEATYNETYETQKKFLFESGADIIVSHNAPSWQSVHAKYQGDPLNCAYVNDFDVEIANMDKPPKFWLHGHVHTNFDYQIANTRVVCHPRGYRFEPTNPFYEAAIFEV